MFSSRYCNFCQRSGQLIHLLEDEDKLRCYNCGHSFSDPKQNPRDMDMVRVLNLPYVQKGLCYAG